MREPQIKEWDFKDWENGNSFVQIAKALWMMICEGRFILVTARFLPDNQVDINIRYNRLTPKGMKFVLRKALEFDDNAEELLDKAKGLIRKD